jgi:hypothetical protein
MSQYAFCESRYSSGTWHIRLLVGTELKLAEKNGCEDAIDSPSLCGKLLPKGTPHPKGKISKKTGVKGHGRGGHDHRFVLDTETCQPFICRKCWKLYKRALLFGEYAKVLGKLVSISPTTQ